MGKLRFSNHEVFGLALSLRFKMLVIFWILSHPHILQVSCTMM